MPLPKDPNMLLSVVNTKLRDFYDSLEDLCAAEDLDPRELTETLARAGFSFDENLHQFVKK